MDSKDGRQLMKEKFRNLNLDSATPKLGWTTLTTNCTRCFLQEMAVTGKDFYNYMPEPEHSSSLIEKISAESEEDRSEFEILWLEFENAMLKKTLETLKEFKAWRDKMNSMMEQACKAAEAGGIFYHPCTGCPEWEW